MLAGSGLPSTPEKGLENTATVLRQLANLTLNSYARLYVIILAGKVWNKEIHMDKC